MSQVTLTVPRLQSLGYLYLHCALSVSRRGQRWKQLGVEPNSELPLDPASRVTRACLEMFLLSLLDHSQSGRSSPGPILSYYGCSFDCWGVFSHVLPKPASSCFLPIVLHCISRTAWFDSTSSPLE